MTDPGVEAARARWAALPARERGALLRAVRRGEQVGEADRALAVAIAERELTRVRRVVRPRRLLLWRTFHGAAAVLFTLVAAAALSGGSTAGVVVYGGLALAFGSSALLARRRLDRQVERLHAAVAANGAPQADAAKV